MKVAIYTTRDEVIILPCQGTKHLGYNDYFLPKGDRDPEEYDLEVVDLPASIVTSLRVDNYERRYDN